MVKAKRNENPLKKTTPDGIPYYRTFNGVRCLLIGGRFRSKERAIKFAKWCSDSGPHGGAEEPGMKAHVVRNPHGKSWLIYRTPEHKDRIGTARIPW